MDALLQQFQQFVEGEGAAVPSDEQRQEFNDSQNGISNDFRISYADWEAYVLQQGERCFPPL